MARTGIIGSLVVGTFAGLAGVAGMAGVATTVRRLTLDQEKLNAAKIHPERVVEALVEKAGMDELDPFSRRRAAEAIHFGYGALWGAVFAVLARNSDIRPIGDGVRLAAPLWLVGFGALLPGIGAHPPFWTWGRREYALTSLAHLAYGVVTVSSVKLAQES